MSAVFTTNHILSNPIRVEVKVEGNERSYRPHHDDCGQPTKSQTFTIIWFLTSSMEVLTLAHTSLQIPHSP
uniref:Uncharacterized protein n=1 Tax=Heterorhabditis bacteriophora TaxID=37862 RepID=A0A1I7WTL7_HETBA